MPLDPRSGDVKIRPYAEADAQSVLSVFVTAVTETASADYSPEQIAAWVRAGQRKLSTSGRPATENTVVAVVNGEIAGFSDVDAQGYIDMMYVGPGHGRRGVASALLAHLQDRAVQSGATELSTNASITARPFFEANGFIVTAERRPVADGVQMTNFRMAKSLVTR